MSNTNSTKRVLMVEGDNGWGRELAQEFMSRGCDVTIATTVTQSVALSRLQRFDLLVSDMGLVDGTGSDVLKQPFDRRTAMTPSYFRD